MKNSKMSLALKPLVTGILVLLCLVGAGFLLLAARRSGAAQLRSILFLSGVIIVFGFLRAASPEHPWTGGRIRWFEDADWTRIL